MTRQSQTPEITTELVKLRTCRVDQHPNKHSAKKEKLKAKEEKELKKKT